MAGGSPLAASTTRVGGVARTINPKTSSSGPHVDFGCGASETIHRPNNHSTLMSCPLAPRTESYDTRKLLPVPLELFRELALVLARFAPCFGSSDTHS